MNDDKFADYSYRLYSSGPNYGITPKFYHISKTPEQGFSSLYSVSHETAHAIEQAGTTKGFKGVVWSERIWIDIDSYEQADKVEEKLNALNLDFISYDTGGRGAHFGILRSNVPDHLLPMRDKQWVQEHFPEADSSIYTHLHPFRLPGTVHSRTGKSKLEVGSKRGKPLTLPPYAEERVKSTLSFQRLVSSGNASIFDDFFVQRNTQEIPKEGERHAQLVRLLYALKEGGYSVELARWWVGETNKRWKPMKEEHEVEKALLSIYR